MVNRRIDQEIDRVNQIKDNLYSYSDSRVDKLESKIGDGISYTNSRVDKLQSKITTKEILKG